MKITRNTHTGKVHLNDLKFGEPFIYNKTIMMLTDAVGAKDGMIIAVNLSSGACVDLSRELMIKRIKVNLKVET